MSGNKAPENNKNRVLFLGFTSAVLLAVTGTVMGTSSEWALTGRGAGSEFAEMRFDSHSEASRVPAVATSDCVACDNLGTLGLQFSMLPNSQKKTGENKLRALLAEKKTLDEGAAAILDLLAQGNGEGADDRMIAVVQFLAETTARDGAHVVLNTIAEKYADKADAVLKLIETKATSLLIGERISRMKLEQIRDAIDAVKYEGQ